jgi:hypothetical protein
MDTFMPYSSAIRDISTIISIFGSGKCGLSSASSERGGISSMVFVPKMASSRMYCSHIGTDHASYALVFGRYPSWWPRIAIFGAVEI